MNMLLFYYCCEIKIIYLYYISNKMAEELEPHINRKFEIIQKLGKGAYGIVWKAIDKKLKQVNIFTKI